MKLFLLCIEIFFARIMDVSLGTIKTMYMVKEKRVIASAIAFVEVLIWFIVAREALNTDLKSILIPIIYSLGYATGTYIGILISSKLIGGTLTVNVISTKIRKKDLSILKDKGFGLTNIKINHTKSLLIIEINKKDFNKLKDYLTKIDKEAFIIVNESKYTQNGYITKNI